MILKNSDCDLLVPAAFPYQLLFQDLIKFLEEMHSLFRSQAGFQNADPKNGPVKLQYA